MTSSMIKKPSLMIRNATLKDVDNISNLVETVYPTMPPLAKDSIKSLIQHFPKGQFVAEFDGGIVGYCACIMVSSEQALTPHNWDDITAKGYGTTHNPKGEYLYGIETCVDPAYWDLHIGHRIYNERKELCIELHLKGIVTGGRLGELAKESGQKHV